MEVLWGSLARRCSCEMTKIDLMSCALSAYHNDLYSMAIIVMASVLT